MKRTIFLQDENAVWLKGNLHSHSTRSDGKLTPEEMKERAEEGYFVRDPERNLVYCPAGEILRQKSIKKNGCIRYANKNACRHCKNRNKCYKGKGEWKEIDFTKDCLEKPCKEWLKAEGKESDIKNGFTSSQSLKCRKKIKMKQVCSVTY